ncbi:MAG: hypothetical protein ACD_75C00927G0003 [uncultured bacterium]|nr:MAG: hypothetical protein ACD_75C00927G0003 [uncultured bacterium]
MELARTRIAFFTIGFIFLYVAAAQSTPLAIKRLGLEQGLSQSTVYTIVQDFNGYMWFGTADGIDIYDGHEFRHFRHNPDDKSSLSGNYVRSLLVSRNGVVWVGTLGGGLNRYYQKTETFSAHRKSDADNSLMSDDIHCLYESTDGFIWIGSEAGVSRYNPEDDSFKHYTHQPDNQSAHLQKGVIRAITQTRDGKMWFGSADHGISSFDPSSGTFCHYRHEDDDANSLSNDAVNAIHQDQKGAIWIATEYGGLNKLDPDSGKFSHYQKPSGNDDGLNDAEVTAIYEDKQGVLWLGTWSGGLNRFDPVDEKFKNYRNSPANPNSLSSDTVISLFEDHSGMLWAGTFDSGVNTIAYQGGNFDNFGFDPLQKNGLIAKMIWSFAEDQNGRIWVGTKKGLSHFDPVAETFASYLAEGKCAGVTDSVDIRSIVTENGHLWLGTAGGGLINLDPATCEIRSYKHDADDPTSLSNNHARLLLKDKRNRLWIGTADGLNSLSPERDALKRYPANPRDSSALPHARIRALYESDSGEIWIGTSGGLSSYNEATDSFTTITAEQGLLSDNDVRSVFQDAGGILWIATEVGLTRYDPRQQTSHFFYEKDGLANDTLYSLLPDGDYLWITTNIGLSRFDRNDYSFKNFHVNDGLQSNEFNFNDYLKTRNSEFYVGGVNGFNRFTPANLGANVSPPKLQLEISLLDKDNVQSRLRVSAQSELQLKAFDHRVSFIAHVMHYLNPLKNTYEYRLTGFDKNWILGRAADKKIAYPGLPPGEYVFQIRAFSSNGIPGDEVISQALSVKPPPWKTVWAYLLYVVVFVIVLFVAMQLRTIALRKRASFLEEAVNNKTVELHRQNETLENQSQKLSTLLRNQDDFYLRTAHELRTPLTLIRIPAKQLSLGEQAADRASSLDIILRATARLQRLTEQMFQAAIHGRTHEAGVQTIDLKAVMAPLFEVYAEVAERKAITFCIAPIPVAAITINRQALEDITHNLLDNALKYTPEGGQIAAKVTLASDSYLLLCVRDNGIGIDRDSKDRIFDRLYRSEQASKFQPQGEGVGLHIVKQHVEACGGNLDFSSEPGQGSEFRVRIPCQWTLDSSACGQSDKHVLPQSKHHDMQWRPGGNQSLLIIEDDDDMQQILKSLLEDKYQLVITGSAAEGLRKAQEQTPDLVLCDVMLPDGSGFDIIHSLKSHGDTSHIPLILLTAVGDLSGRKTGWEKGADDYIVKPFAKDDLLCRIGGLLANRKRLQEWYKRKFSYGVDNGQICDNEKREELDFIVKLETQTLILIENGNCRLENLAEAMGQSGRTLQRRLKSILDYSYTEYIQSVQFKKARQLLLGGCSVKEAAFEAGFNDPTYFSKVFKSLHGISPSQYRRPTAVAEESRQ